MRRSFYPGRILDDSMTSPAGGREDALFTPRFFALFTFTFTVFMSAFQLFQIGRAHV